MKRRAAREERKTSETRITVELDLDRRGESRIRVRGIPFFQHMLELLAKHSGMTMKISAEGDTHVDDHHTVEDLGICFGKALKKALGDKAGINRYGSCHMVMDEVLVRAVADVSGRPHLEYHVEDPCAAPKKGARHIRDFDIALVEHFFDAVVKHSFLTLHIDLVRAGKGDLHHIIEAVFKGFARALKEAVARTGDRSIPSTKGRIE
jgi:imidazoleglycerol-phosphate dehydratase